MIFLAPDTSPRGAGVADDSSQPSWPILCAGIAPAWFDAAAAVRSHRNQPANEKPAAPPLIDSGNTPPQCSRRNTGHRSALPRR
jgi:hypothetical protein